MKTILILDDEMSVCQSFVDYFEDKMWKTYRANNGETALLILEQENIDAAIVDIRLPGIDGNEFIREASKNNPQIAYLICTGSPEYTIPDELKNMDCVSNHFFKKPVHSIAEIEKELLRLIEKIKNKT